MKTKFYSMYLLGAAASVLVSCSSNQFSSAEAQPISPPPASLQPTDAALPPDIQPSSPLAQVIKLVQASVDEGIIQNYVANSTSTFNLDADKIIYLNDVGAPKDLVNAMMQRDQTLQAQMAASTPPPMPPPAPATPTTYVETAPPPEPEVVTVNYFNETLQPYGNWVVIEGYGRCWRPTVAVYNAGWQPYCDRGHWISSDCGWYWNSDYSWGMHVPLRTLVPASALRLVLVAGHGLGTVVGDVAVCG